jgi:predicted DNA-binding transcriptional regulator AlpA
MKPARRTRITHHAWSCRNRIDRDRFHANLTTAAPVRLGPGTHEPLSAICALWQNAGGLSMNVNPNIAVEDRLLNLEEAARRARIAASTLRAILYRGGGPTAIKLPSSNRWRFRASDIDAWIDAGVVKRRQATKAA